MKNIGFLARHLAFDLIAYTIVMVLSQVVRHLVGAPLIEMDLVLGGFVALIVLSGAVWHRERRAYRQGMADTLTIEDADPIRRVDVSHRTYGHFLVENEGVKLPKDVDSRHVFTYRAIETEQEVGNKSLTS